MIQQKGYRYYYSITKRLYISKHVTFWENTLYYTLSNNPTFSTKISLSIDPLFNSPITEASHIPFTLLTILDPVVANPINPVFDCSNYGNFMPCPDSACLDNGLTLKPTRNC